MPRRGGGDGKREARAGQLLGGHRGERHRALLPGPWRRLESMPVGTIV